MNKLTYKIIRKILIILNKKSLMDFDIKYYRSKGITIGSNNRIFSNIVSPEPYLISIGNSVTISTGVSLITHDNSISKLDDNVTDTFGEINIGDNCFIGLNSIIMPGVKLGNNTIVAAGSVVTKSFSNGNVVIGGNPAKPIIPFERYKKNALKMAFNTKGMSYCKKKESIMQNKDKLIAKKESNIL